MLPAEEDVISALNTRSLGYKVFQLLPSGEASNAAEARHTLIAFASRLGACVPHTADPQSLVWDIKTTDGDSAGINTFSKHNREAGFHTDSQYTARPEECFLLYCLRPARCGGGVNFILTSEQVTELVNVYLPSQDRRNLQSVMYPFLVPGEFTSSHGSILYSSVLSESPSLRFRFDTMKEGWLRLGGDIRDPRWHSVEKFEALVHRSVPSQLRLTEGQVLVVNNHATLHARSRFADRSRHLLRARVRFRI